MIRIGIDPDVDKNGVAVYDTETRELKLYSLRFSEAIDFICDIKDNSDTKVEVMLEAGWYNKKASWRLGFKDSKEVCALKGYHVGRNHQRGMDIEEALRARGFTNDTLIPHAPFKKQWSGKDGKITHKELAMLCAQRPPIIFNHKVSNQEERDAALFAIA